MIVICHVSCVSNILSTVHFKEKGIRRRRMDVNLIKQTVEHFHDKGLKEVIPSTMGEPLMYKQFGEIIEVCRKYNVKMNLTTNGTFYGRGVEAWARDIVPIGSDVKISWNAATKKTQEAIMKNTNWEKVLQNVKTFIRIRDEHAAQGGNRCRVTFQLTFLQTNIDELADIVQLASDLGVDRVKGHHLWAHFKEIKDLSMRRNKPAINRWNKAVEEAKAVAAACAANGRAVLLEGIYRLDENADQELLGDGVCPFLGQEAWVNAEGRFDPCCAPDEQRKQLGYFGNLNDKSLSEIWNGPAYHHLMETYQNRALCINCNMRR
eukprot:TRINITY_DN61215_c0_g1_i2.p2 TRINITY_DN61215_c0_g1~~TRINITY_DN61215_c0_g1_i2.p2  ORF type:complete len:320 (+),score=33.91 TRINITY_DN61215_c0_g1_i2:1565-2524(+)